jgi:DNA-binding NarL/FixJ family response regulator
MNYSKSDRRQTVGKILIIDDEAIIGLQLETILSSMGLEVVGVGTSGKEALTMAKKLNPDLILMDIVMRGEMNGIDAGSKIKSKFKIPIIFITAHADNKWVKKAKRIDPFGYILKPFQEEQIKATVEIALHRIDLETQLREMENMLRSERDQLEKMVAKQTEELLIKSQNLEDVNFALKSLLKKRDEEKSEFEDRVQVNIEQMVLPYMEKLQNTNLDSTQRTMVDILATSLQEVTSSFSHTLSTKFRSLTPKEIQIANLIKQGQTTRAIAKMLNISKRTIDAHRNHIREKLGLKKRGGNLRTHLLSIR